MSTTYKAITAGWSAPLEPVTLKTRVNGVETPFPLPPGYTVRVVIRDGAGNVVSLDGTSVVKRDQELYPGQVIFTPKADGTTFDPANFSALRKKQDYTFHWCVTDSNGKEKFWPNGDPDIQPVCRQ